jgi:hypothetical protein
LGSVESKSHESTNAIPTACLSNINEKAPRKPISKQPNQMAASSKRGECSNSSKRVKRVCSETLWGITKLSKKHEAMHARHEPARLSSRACATNHFGQNGENFASTPCFGDRRGVHHRLRREMRICEATSPKQWRHSVERETNRHHQSHTRLRHTGGKRWQRLGALNHRENLLVECG